MPGCKSWAIKEMSSTKRPKRQAMHLQNVKQTKAKSALCTFPPRRARQAARIARYALGPHVRQHAIKMSSSSICDTCLQGSLYQTQESAAPLERLVHWDRLQAEWR